MGFRYNPFMTSRAGFAWHNEYNWLHQDGTGPLAGLNTANVNTSELLTGFDLISRRGINMRTKLRTWSLLIGACGFRAPIDFLGPAFTEGI